MHCPHKWSDMYAGERRRVVRMALDCFFVMRAHFALTLTIAPFFTATMCVASLCFLSYTAVVIISIEADNGMFAYWCHTAPCSGYKEHKAQSILGGHKQRSSPP